MLWKAATLKPSSPVGSLCSHFGGKVLVFSSEMGSWFCLFCFVLFCFVLYNLCSEIQDNLTDIISCGLEDEHMTIRQAASPVIL